MKSGFYMTTENNQLNGWSKKKFQSTSQSQTYIKKGWWLLFWWSVGLIHYSFLNPGETVTSEKYAQQIDEMHWKTQCLQPALVNRMSPILHHNTPPPCHTTKLSKVERIGLHSFASSTTFTSPLTNWLQFLQTSWQFFAGKNTYTTSRRQKMISKSSSNPEAGIFMLQE